MDGDCRIFHAKEPLQGHQLEDIGETVFEQDAEDFAVTRHMRGKLHRRLDLVENHVRHFSA